MKAGPAQVRASESNLELCKYLNAIILSGHRECPDLFGIRGIKLVCKEVLRLFRIQPQRHNHEYITINTANVLKLRVAVILENDLYRQSHSF